MPFKSVNFYMQKQFRYIMLLVIILFLGGSAGYYFLEDWPFLDSLYMTIITLSTTGFKEVHPLSPGGQMLTMVLIIFGISILLYAIREFNIVLFEGKYFRERKMQKKISQLENHYIICGFGRMGKKIAQELSKREETFVIIEKEIADQDEIEQYLFFTGNATEDDCLIKTGINKAKGLVSVLSSDIANTYTTLSARQLNPNLKIIARAEEESSKEKILKAGADRVILPYEIGGFRITQALLKPTVMEYIDEIFSRSDMGLEIEEILLAKGSILVEKTIADSNIRNAYNIIIVGISRNKTGLIYNPRPDTKLMADDILIVIGEREDLTKLEEIAIV